MISFISAFEIIKVVPNLKILFEIAESVADIAAINLKGTYILLANGISTLFINHKATPVKGARKLSKPPFWQIFWWFLSIKFLFVLTT